RTSSLVMTNSPFWRCRWVRHATKTQLLKSGDTFVGAGTKLSYCTILQCPAQSCGAISSRGYAYRFATVWPSWISRRLPSHKHRLKRLSVGFTIKPVFDAGTPVRKVRPAIGIRLFGCCFAAVESAFRHRCYFLLGPSLGPTHAIRIASY